MIKKKCAIHQVSNSAWLLDKKGGILEVAHLVCKFLGVIYQESLDVVKDSSRSTTKGVGSSLGRQIYNTCRVTKFAKFDQSRLRAKNISITVHFLLVGIDQKHMKYDLLNIVTQRKLLAFIEIMRIDVPETDEYDTLKLHDQLKQSCTIHESK